MSAPIVITVPKYVAISPSPMPRVVENTPPLINTVENEKGKKRRLDHLTWEEKIQRKKLKNRVAAQTSRDRKKAKMDEMERTIKILTQQTEILQNKCNSLQSINESLLEKNSRLDRQVEDLQRQLDELKSSLQSDNVSEISGRAGSNSNESIRSAVSNPRQKGVELKLAQCGTKDNTAALWKIIALCLLYKTCSKISMPENWKNLPRVYSQKSPQAWRMILHQAAQTLPKVQAAQSDCLDQWWGPQQKSWNPAKISVTA